MKSQWNGDVSQQIVDEPLGSSSVETKLTYNKPPTSLAQLLERYAAVQGGPEKIKEIQSLRLSGKLLQEGKEYEFSQVKRVPNRSRITIGSEEQTLSTYTNGSEVWRIYQDYPAVFRVSGDEAETAKRSAIILSPLWTERDRKDVLTLLPDEPLDGVMHHRVELAYPGETPTIFWINPETYLESQTVTQRSTGEEVVTKFSDNRKVSWLMIPYVVEVFVDGKKNTEITLDKADLNIGLFDSYFDPPEMTEEWPPKRRR
ncbi:hypothetical protein GCM10007047_17160 [Cerasicoccus arenae]|uniref:Outer membrane lipoprotein-sorting protein n=2 Tax=Cerasicoccus arenae TaxID=424488 RepID=A0A8J3DH37_9BACT|nr:hypothetical protein GCM10007047_17160 [Cerasicoccus arenae]